MKNHELGTGGYAGLIVLMISAAIIAFLIVRTDIFSGGEDPRGALEAGLDAVDEAEALKIKLEQNSQPIRQTQ